SPPTGCSGWATASRRPSPSVARPRRFRGAVLGLACALAAWGLTAVPFVRGVEDWVLDGLFFYRGARSTTARVVIIGLDEPSLRELKKPITHLSPELTRVVRLALDQGATAVGLDLVIPADNSHNPELARTDGPGEGWTVSEDAPRPGRVDV